MIRWFDVHLRKRRTRMNPPACSFSVVLAVAAAAAQEPETVAWRNGAWFDRTGFRRVDVYSIGDRLTLKSPSKVDRTVDLTGKFLMGAFGEAHNHNIPSGDTERTIRTYLEQGIFYVMIQTNVPEAPAKLKPLINRPDSVDVLFANGSFTAPGGHPTALVRRNVANGGMTNEDWMAASFSRCDPVRTSIGSGRRASRSSGPTSSS